MKMKKVISVVLACACVFSFAACGSKSDSSKSDSAKSDKKEKLVMATNAEFPPFESYDGDEVVGIDAEFAAAIADKLGMDLKIEDMAFDSIIPAVQSGKADIGAAGMTVTEDRATQVDFSDSYYTGVQVIIVTDDSDITEPDDLKGKKIGVQQGTTGDIYSTDDHVRKLRRSIAAVYYEVYKAAIKRALQEQAISPILRMFFDFGFMDSGLLGEEYTEQLYAVAERLSECNSEHVYTMYEWLKSIYIGKNEPSKNEFDLDYPAYLADLRRNGTITKKEQEEWKDDQWKKVEYEIENMFTSSNRAVYGKISTFIPILCEYDIVNSVETMLVTAARINEALDKIRSVDFSIFYRDTTFSDPAHDITREFLKKEVLPDVILMPNAGTKAMMWQETAGGRRDTSARFLFPVMTAGNLDELMLETAGRFRWEMCRKEQGARWNDIREMSLTSEYYDYVQYYKKNHDLSPEAKEKLKNALWKAKNNYREVFVKDYQVWIKYEAKGSFRMNRVARGILFRYCPFVKEIRDSLKVSPMYQEMIQKYDIIIGREKRHVALFEDKYRKAGGELTEEMIVNKEFYEM